MNQEQKTHWRYFGSKMQTMLQEITSHDWSPIIEASGDERLLLRLFRTLPEKVQDEFLEEIGKKAFLSVYPDIEEDEDEANEQLGDEIRRLMPDPPDDEAFKQAVEGYDVTAIIFRSSRRDGRVEADLAADAASYQDAVTCCDFSPEQVEGYIAEWREKVVAEIEWRVASKKLDSPTLDYLSRRGFVSLRVPDLIAQALAVIGGKIVVEFPCDCLKSTTICRNTMSVVEMATELHALLEFLHSKGNKHWSSSNVSNMEFALLDLSSEMHELPDRSLLKQVDYQKKIIQLMETMLSGYTNHLKQQKLDAEVQQTLKELGGVLEAVQKIFRDKGTVILVGQYSDRPELLDLSQNLKTMDDPELREAIVRMFQSHPNKALSEATQKAMLRVIQDSSRTKQQQDQELTFQLQSLIE